MIWRRYNDDVMEYRHVELPKQMLKVIPKDFFRKDSSVLKFLWEDEWRSLGITQVWPPLSYPFLLKEHRFKCSHGHGGS